MVAAWVAMAATPLTFEYNRWGWGKGITGKIALRFHADDIASVAHLVSVDRQTRGWRGSW